MGTCYIVGAGEFFGNFCPDKTDLVIAADGGYTELAKRGIRCDLLIGDLDSLGNVPSGVELLKFPVEKDETDMHLAFLEGVRRGYSHFELFGGTGGRPDHTFANYCLLILIKRSGCTATLYGDGHITYVIENEFTRVEGKSGKGISVFAFGGAAHGVLIDGLKYTANDVTLTPEFSLGVSNSFVSDTAKIGVREGCLLVIQEI